MRRTLALVLLTLGALVALAGVDGSAFAKKSGGKSASSKKSKAKKSGKGNRDKAEFERDRAAFKKKFRAWKAAKKYRGCRFQRPRKSLKRSSFIKKKQLQPTAHQRAVAYRAEHYGLIPGLNLENYHSTPVTSQIVQTTFFGKSIQIHERIEPALICVEKRLKKVCNKKKATRYIPKAVGGLRTSNTYRGGEISNHLFGIAIDIDTDRNPCCGCVAPWPDHPKCKKKAKSDYERTDLSKCWVDTFEKYGFYWLGRDELKDYMHFEFLGDPDKILP